MFRQSFSFNGRIRRLEYGLSAFLYVFGLYGGLIAVFILATASPWFLIILPFQVFAVGWFWLSQSVKRSHDLGNSGWLILIPFYSLLLLFADGQSGENRYGMNPKNVGNNYLELDSIGTDTFL